MVTVLYSGYLVNQFVKVRNRKKKEKWKRRKMGWNRKRGRDENRKEIWKVRKWKENRDEDPSGNCYKVSSLYNL